MKNVKADYERLRESRYQGCTREASKMNDYLEAYFAWASAPYGREKEWDTYCDLRDGLPKGTNRRLRASRRGEN